MTDCKEQTNETVDSPKEQCESVAFDDEKCQEMLAQGKRNLLCGEVPQSVNQLQEVCRLLAAQYGETGAECADAYLQYGSALLELSRMESRVLGNALQGMTEDTEEAEKDNDMPDDSFTVPSNITDAEKEKISEEIIDAMLETDDKDTDQKPTENTDEQSAENLGETSTANLPDADTTDTATESASMETETVAKEMDPTAEVQASDVAKQQSAVTEETVATVTGSVDEKGDSGKGDADETDGSDRQQSEPATETGAGDATFQTATPGKAQRVPVTTTTTEDGTTDAKADDDADESDSETENQLNPDEYEDDTTEFEQSETAADTQTEEEEVSNLQLAWEMLELAKNIYNKQEGTDSKRREAECLKKLGEVGLESEQYSQSIEDFTSCLEVLKSCVADVKTDRSVAETHYHIGVTCAYAGRYDDAVTHFRDAITVLEAKNAGLEALVAAADSSGGDGSKETDEVAAARREMKDIAELIPEIKMKIDDTEEEKSSVHLKDVINSRDAVTTVGFGSEESASTSASVIGIKPVDDVTHLVRKKRKPEDEEVSVDDAKKLKTIETVTDDAGPTDARGDSETVVNGCSDAVVNGCHDVMETVESDIKVKSAATTAAADEAVAME